MPTGIHMLKRIPAGLPFTMRTGKAKAALLMLAIAVIVEPVFLAITLIDPEMTEAIGFGGGQVVVAVLLVLCWLVLAFRRATFGLSDAGVWIWGPRPTWFTCRGRRSSGWSRCGTSC